MCDVLDAIEKRGYDMGFDEGEESKARKDSIGMYRNGYMDGNRGIYI